MHGTNKGLHSALLVVMLEEKVNFHWAYAMAMRTDGVVHGGL